MYFARICISKTHYKKKNFRIIDYYDNESLDWKHFQILDTSKTFEYLFLDFKRMNGTSDKK